MLFKKILGGPKREWEYLVSFYAFLHVFCRFLGCLGLERAHIAYSGWKWSGCALHKRVSALDDDLLSILRDLCDFWDLYVLVIFRVLSIFCDFGGVVVPAGVLRWQNGSQQC